jgi:histidinol phosphatase-like PHP family hydrolase/predicted nuclease with RNAse H fold/dephospho-CoA kinase
MAVLDKGRQTRRQRATERSSVTDAHVLAPDYFRVRDFEYVQPLYDLAFLLEVEALAKGTEVPKYRTFSLWRAAYSLDGYTTNIDRWLAGTLSDEDLDYVPSGRIKQYLANIRKTGSIPELRPYRNERFERCLRLRSVRGLGPSKIALTVSSRTLKEEWFSQAAISLALHRDRISELYRGSNTGPWQTAHVVPPLIRLLRAIDTLGDAPIAWHVSGVTDPFEPINGVIAITARASWHSVAATIGRALKRERFFVRDSKMDADSVRIRHRMGWSAVLSADPHSEGCSVQALAESLDPLASSCSSDLLSDLHMHTAWSDGSASVNTMAGAVVRRGLKYFAVTDHSRSSKVQGGLTPPLWIRQENALSLASPVCPVLHGIEVDVHKDGTLDLPGSLLAAADIVIGSVHSNWTDDARTNTERLVRAIESGCIDVIGHPTSGLIGKPGVPDYFRAAADVHWDEVFERCARWRVAVELNCFPSRLDLPLDLLGKAVRAGCAISLGSDAHARSHLSHLRFGEAALRRLDNPFVLNRLSYEALRKWIRESRKERQRLAKSRSGFVQAELQFDVSPNGHGPLLKARVLPPQSIPSGSRVIGIDLTAGEKATGMALLEGCAVKTCSLVSDEDILKYVQKHKPALVSIDSPLGLPGGGESINPRSGIVRVAEHELASIGIPAYPALIDSMKNLTLRGIRVKRLIEQLPCRPRVIESYPGAAQDILCLPRKQRGLDLLREGLRRLGLKGSGLKAISHDEIDAITSAVVGRYYEAGLFEPMGIPSEAELIVPKVRPLGFEANPVICLAGKTGAGKSVVARYLSVFYGFSWIRTRDVIRQLLIKDSRRPEHKRIFHRVIDPSNITEEDLREFGALILEVHHQVPLRRELSATVAALDIPVVVDSVRDAEDVERAAVSGRPVFVWFIDCAESILRDRLAKKTKSGQRRPAGPSPVDRTAPEIQRRADNVIPNSSSLEDLRWRLDDALFAIMALQQ